MLCVRRIHIRFFDINSISSGLQSEPVPALPRRMGQVPLRAMVVGLNPTIAITSREARAGVGLAA